MIAILDRLKEYNRSERAGADGKEEMEICLSAWQAAKLAQGLLWNYNLS